MFSLETTLFSVGLIVVSLLLLWQNFRSYQAQRKQPSERERNFAFRQFRRRWQTSAMIGMVGLALLIGQFLPRIPWLVGLYWIVVLLIVIWILLLAIVDMLHTRFHFGRMRNDQKAEHDRLNAELRRHRDRMGNGSHDHENHP